MSEVGQFIVWLLTPVVTRNVTLFAAVLIFFATLLGAAYAYLAGIKINRLPMWWTLAWIFGIQGLRMGIDLLGFLSGGTDEPLVETTVLPVVLVGLMLLLVYQIRQAVAAKNAEIRALSDNIVQLRKLLDAQSRESS